MNHLRSSKKCLTDKELVYFEDINNSKSVKYINKLPKNLTYLTFGDEFNQKVNNLPKNLTHLIKIFQFWVRPFDLKKTVGSLCLGFRCWGSSFFYFLDNFLS